MSRARHKSLILLCLATVLSACTGPAAIIGTVASTIAKTAENAEDRKAGKYYKDEPPAEPRIYDRQEIADANLSLAVAYIQQDQYQLALEKLERARIAQPDYALVYNTYGVLYQKLGDNTLAEENFKKALKLTPENPDILNNYASFLCQTDRYEEAEQTYLQAAGNPLYPTPEIALTNAGSCARNHDKPDIAEKYLRQALDKNPNVPVALYQMAELSCDQGAYPEARGYLQRYLQFSKHNSRSLWLGIRIEEQLGDKNALASYKLLLRNQFADSREAQLLQESEARY